MILYAQNKKAKFEYEWLDTFCQDFLPDYIYNEEYQGSLVYLENSTLFKKTELKVV